VREGARHPEDIGRYLGNVLSLRLLLAPLALGALAAILLIPGLEGLLLPGFAMMVTAALSNVLRSTFYARRRLFFEGLAIVLESGLLLGLTVYGVRSRQPVDYYLWAYAGAYGFSCLYFALVIAASRLVRVSWSLDIAFLRGWLVKSLPFALTSGLTMLYFKIDVPILQLLRNFQEVGWYTFAYKPMEALLFLPTTMLSVAFPVLSVYFHQRERETLLRAINSLFKALLALGWPITVGTVVLAPALTRMLHLYPQSQPALEILGVGIFLMFVTTAFTAALNSVDKQHLLAWAAVASLGANLTELVLLAVAWFMVRRVLAQVPVIRLSWRILLAGLAMGLVLIWFRNLQGPVTLALAALGAGVYAGAMILLRTFDASELALARSALRIGGGPA
jgi:O-antigen/teichoic acid export membrane protein